MRLSSRRGSTSGSSSRAQPDPLSRAFRGRDETYCLHGPFGRLPSAGSGGEGRYLVRQSSGKESEVASKPAAQTRPGKPRAFELLRPNWKSRRRVRGSSSAPGSWTAYRAHEAVDSSVSWRHRGTGRRQPSLQWAARDRREFAWVSLDRRDNDPVVLLTYVAEALNADGAIEPAVFKGLTSAGDAVWTRGLPRLGAALAARREACCSCTRRRSRARES